MIVSNGNNNDNDNGSGSESNPFQIGKFDNLIC